MRWRRRGGFSTQSNLLPHAFARKGAALVLLGVLAVLAGAGCDRPTPEPADAPAAAERPGGVGTPATAGPAREHRDLAVDESLGGHTLARHVGRTDAQLAERLRREPQISAASTYTDRATAEAVIGSTLASSSSRVNAWLKRTGPRPNLVLHYSGRARQPIGRSLSRRDASPVSCESALVVLRWDERRSRFYVLTSYPEVDR